ncbi:MAG: GC-type dockerin domain-anchored protein [Planctomycetota bacterium]
MNPRQHRSIRVSCVAAMSGMAASWAAAGGPTRAYIIEGSAFFGAPGIELGSLAAVDLSDPSIVTPIARPAVDLRFGGADVRPGTGELVAFENTTNSVRVLSLTDDSNTLIDSIGWMEPGVAGFTFSNDGSVAYSTTNVSGFGRIVRSDADTGAVLSVHNILNLSLNGLATVPEGHPTFTPDEVWGLGLTGSGGVRLYRLDLDTNTVVSNVLVTGVGFNAQFDGGLDWAADGTLYAAIQGFRQTGPDSFEEISANLFTIDPVSGAATSLGVVEGDGTWDAVTLALDDQQALPCVADFAEPLGVLNFFDVSAFIGAYNAMDPAADLAEPFGAFNFFDVAAYIAAYNAGCP